MAFFYSARPTIQASGNNRVRYAAQEQFHNCSTCQMTVQTLESLYDYSYWANDRLFQVLSQLTPDEFTQPVAGGHKSIRNTMVHVLSTEWGWLSRCGGHERKAKLDPDDYPTTESLVDEWNDVESYVRDFLGDLEDDDSSRHVEYTGGEGKQCSVPLRELMQHSIVHAAHYRGQVALLLRELDYAPGHFDLLFDFAGKCDAPEWSPPEAFIGGRNPSLLRARGSRLCVVATEPRQVIHGDPDVQGGTCINGRTEIPEHSCRRT